LDYTYGVLPVTQVDHKLDQLPANYAIRSLNTIAQAAYKHYDANQMHGLPVGIQVVGQRLQDEQVLTIMKRIEESLRAHKEAVASAFLKTNYAHIDMVGVKTTQ